MAFADPYNAIVDQAQDTQVTAPYALVVNGGTSSIRRWTAGTAGAPRRLEISHSTVGKGAAARDRRVVTHTCYAVVDGAEDPTKSARIYTVVDIPQAGITAAQKVDLWRYHVGLLRGKGGLVNYGDPTKFWEGFLEGFV